jgi:pyruvate kinase
MIKTKIVATLGPACASVAAILSLMSRGVDIFRINFSQGDLEQHLNTLNILNQAREKFGGITAVMGDLCGPKIRTGIIRPDAQEVKAGAKVIIEPGRAQGTVHHFGTNYEAFTADVQAGQRVFIDDGKIVLRVLGQNGRQTECEVLSGGVLRSRKGINLPDTKITAPSLTEYDWQCVAWAMGHDIDLLALSFVRSVQDIQCLQDVLQDAQSDIRIIAKLETPQAIAQKEAIILASDATLVARGDLGVEMTLARVPLLQKEITQFCRVHGKPVIVATQMLESMVSSPTATRAEVSDIANAMMDFTDAVLLSGETAIGRYPDQVVDTIQEIAAVTESGLDGAGSLPPAPAACPELQLPATMAQCAAQIAHSADARLVAVWSQQGRLAQFLGKARMRIPILSFSSSLKQCQQLCLNYGVIPCCCPMPTSIEQFARLIDRVTVAKGLATAGDKVVLVTGPSLGAEVSSNAIVIHTVTQAQPAPKDSV